MEILKFLLDFFVKNQENPTLKSVFSLLEKNSFDIKKVISNFSIDGLMPIIEDFLSQNKKPDEHRVDYNNDFSGTKPIKEICDQEIMLALNSYIGV